jgi:hypothetical protein
MVEMVECLPSKCESLSLNPSTVKKRKRKNPNKQKQTKKSSRPTPPFDTDWEIFSYTLEKLSL